MPGKTLLKGSCGLPRLMVLPKYSVVSLLPGQMSLDQTICLFITNNMDFVSGIAWFPVGYYALHLLVTEKGRAFLYSLIY